MCGLEVGLAMRILTRVRDLAEESMRHGVQPVLLVSPHARHVVRQFLARDFPMIPVISHAEVPPEFQVHVLGQINVEAAVSAA